MTNKLIDVELQSPQKEGGGEGGWMAQQRLDLNTGDCGLFYVSD